MKRVILIDGNNLLFRSYYATAYAGSLMKNSKNFPTNGVYGFVNMINKIIAEEKPEYIMVAFDKGKNFRHDKYENYKAGRVETPSDLKVQFPKAYEVLDAMGIKAVDADLYEADDIIGTFAKMADNDKEYDATIISSDKDLLQLISNDVNVKLLKQHDYILMDEKVFFDTYQTQPIKMIDLKALMGDSSDNIPGVKGIGEKTAISLISKYGSLEGVYENLDKISDSTRKKLETDKDNAFFSKEIATIYKDVPLNMTFEDIKWNGIDKKKLIEVYRDLEFWTMIKKLESESSEDETTIVKKEIDSNTIYTNEKIDINKDFAFFLELDGENYHKANILGLSIYDGTKCYFLDKEGILNNKEIFKYAKYTYDLKKAIVSLGKLGIEIKNCIYDLMICAYLLNYNVKDDVAYIAGNKGYDIAFYETLVKKGEIIKEISDFRKCVGEKSIFIYNTYDLFLEELKSEGMENLFNTIEMPLISVLAKMEINGFKVDVSVIDEMKMDLEAKLSIISNQIYNMAGEEFNISSPKQLGDILFEKLNLPHGKKKANGYPTDHDTLVKLKDKHNIIPLILEYRNISKLISTYMDSLKTYVMQDSKIHTIYKQAVTRTGRLSSVEPNLQNIPIRDDLGKQIRKAFKPEDNEIIMSSDYSQIELRVLAHITKDEALNRAFNNNEDIHTRVASDVYGVPFEAVSKVQRRNAKAVIFGIVYGISGFGLSENLEDVTPGEAKLLIDKYLNMYSGVKEYMDNIVSEAKEKGYTRTMFNRKRVIDELKNTNYIIRKAGERIALNTPIQGSSADIIKMAMIKVDEEMSKRNLRSKMLVQVHDELVFSVPSDEVETMKTLVKDVMENIVKLSVPLKVEIESGSDWYNAK